MKILHYTPVYAPAWCWGGPPRSISNLCEGLASLGHDVRVLTTNCGLEGSPEIPIDKLCYRNGVKVRYFPAQRGGAGIRSPGLEAAIREEIGSCDILHVTGVWQPTCVSACRAAQSIGRAYVVSPRGALGRYSFTQKRWKKLPYWWMWERRNVDRASGIHCTSDFELKELMRLGLSGRCFVVPNSINISLWRRDPTAGLALRESLGISVNAPLFLVAGRIHHKKGLDLLPEMLDMVRDIPWRLIVMGDDEDRTKMRIRAEFASRGLSARIAWLPFGGNAELVAAYSAADALLMPSLHENFGNTVVEALGCGCAVVASDKVGVACELKGCEGVTVLPRKVLEWAKILKTPFPRTTLPREHLERIFSRESVAKGVLEEYVTCLDA